MGVDLNPGGTISWFLKHPENRHRALSEICIHISDTSRAGRSTGELLQSECRTFRERIGVECSRRRQQPVANSVPDT
jgi:hypothetical protein